MAKFKDGQIVQSKTHGVVKIRSLKADSHNPQLVQYDVELKSRRRITISEPHIEGVVDAGKFNDRLEVLNSSLLPLQKDLLLLIAEFAGEVMNVGEDLVALDPGMLAALSGVNRFFRDMVMSNRQQLGFYGQEVRAHRQQGSMMERPVEIQIQSEGVQAVKATCEKLLHSDLLAIQRVGDYILDTYPPDKYLYLGIGGSPTPITAYLRSCGTVTRVVDVPVSALNSYVTRYEEIWDDETSRGHVIRYLDGYLGPVVRADTKLLAIDYSTGNSLFVIEYLLRKYLEHRYAIGPDVARGRVLPLAINSEIKRPPEELKSRTEWIKLEKDPLFEQLLMLLDSAVFKDMAYRLYDKHHIVDVMGGAPAPPPTIVQYQDLCAQLRTFLKTYPSKHKKRNENQLEHIV